MVDGDILELCFDMSFRAIVLGQVVVLYDVENVICVLGGGWIMCAIEVNSEVVV